MNFLLSLINGEDDERVHAILTRYGKGTFDGPALEAGVARGKLKASASYLYLPILAQFLAERCESDLSIQGVIISRDVIDAEIRDHGLKVLDARKRGGIKYKVSGTLEPSQFNAIYEDLWGAALLLKAKGGPCSLSCGSTVPKPNKYSDPSFCRLVMPSSEDNPSALFATVAPGATAAPFENMSIRHTIRVDDLFVPSELAGKPAAVLRRLAKRRGVLSRSITVDGLTIDEVFDFLA